MGSGEKQSRALHVAVDTNAYSFDEITNTGSDTWTKDRIYGS